MAAELKDYQDGVTGSGFGSNDSSTVFSLLGGLYAVSCSSTGTASITVETETPDGSYVAVGAAVTTYSTFSLPPGRYKVVTGSAFATGSFAVIRVPYRSA